MENDSNKGLSELSILEIARDLFCFIYIFESQKYCKDLEARNYVSLFLKDTAPVIEHEIANCFENTAGIPKDEFFNTGIKKRVKKERNRIKRIISKSSNISSVKKEMGLDFMQKTYDMNIKLCNGCLQDMNYEMFMDDLKNSDFWSSLFSFPKRILQAIFMGLNYDVTVEELIAALKNNFTETAEKIDEELSGERLSYSVNKLFSKSSDLEEKDKVLILYRYRLITCANHIESVLPELNIVQGQETLIDFHAFFRKWKAIIIEIMGREIEALNTRFSKNIQSKIDNAVCEKEFFKINRQLRDNLHYSEISILGDKEIELLDKWQLVYLSIIQHSFSDNLYIDIDKECKKMTGFLNCCYKKGLSKDELLKNYNYYYIKYSIFKKV